MPVIVHPRAWLRCRHRLSESAHGSYRIVTRSFCCGPHSTFSFTDSKRSDGSSTSQVLGCTEFEMRGVYAVSSGFSPHDFAAVTDGAHLFMRIEDLLPRLLAIGQGRLSLLPQICNATFEKQVRDVSGHVPAHQRANSYRDIVVKELHSNVNPSF